MGLKNLTSTLKTNCEFVSIFAIQIYPHFISKIDIPGHIVQHMQELTCTIHNSIHN